MYRSFHPYDVFSEIDRLQRERAAKLYCLPQHSGSGPRRISGSYLRHFPIDTLKIDKSFVRDIPEHQDDMEIATAIIQLAHILGFTVLAEGVETEALLSFLRNQGCDLYQGYFFNKPLPAEAFIKLWQ